MPKKILLDNKQLENVSGGLGSLNGKDMWNSVGEHIMALPGDILTVSVCTVVVYATWRIMNKLCK